MIRDRNLLAQLPHMYTLSVGLFVHTCTSATGENVAKMLDKVLLSQNVGDDWKHTHRMFRKMENFCTDLLKS